MANIKPVSDLRNYNTVLDDVKEGEPVFLTRNGRGCYVIVDVKDIENMKKTDEKINLIRAYEQARREAEAAGQVDREKLKEDYKELLKKLDD